jgi:hypothetical protein
MFCRSECHGHLSFGDSVNLNSAGPNFPRRNTGRYGGQAEGVAEGHAVGRPEHLGELQSVFAGRVLLGFKKSARPKIIQARLRQRLAYNHAVVREPKPRQQ